jgi:hypothetical protein
MKVAHSFYIRDNEFYDYYYKEKDMPDYEFLGNYLGLGKRTIGNCSYQYDAEVLEFDNKYVFNNKIIFIYCKAKKNFKIEENMVLIPYMTWNKFPIYYKSNNSIVKI